MQHVSMKNVDKLQRYKERLLKGELLYRLPSGQYKFGGNKFCNTRWLQRLPLKLLHINNRNWEVYTIDLDRL